MTPIERATLASLLERPVREPLFAAAGPLHGRWIAEWFGARYAAQATFVGLSDAELRELGRALFRDLCRGQSTRDALHAWITARQSGAAGASSQGERSRSPSTHEDQEVEPDATGSCIETLAAFDAWTEFLDELEELLTTLGSSGAPAQAPADRVWHDRLWSELGAYLAAGAAVDPACETTWVAWQERNTRSTKQPSWARAGELVREHIACRGRRGETPAAAYRALWEGLPKARKQLQSVIAIESMARNRWLRWTHAWPDPREPSDAARGSRAHSFARLLLALTGDERFLWSVNRLDGRLADRKVPPWAWAKILAALLLRRALLTTDLEDPEAARPAASGTLDLRCLSAAKLLRAWLDALPAASPPRSFAEWLKDVSAEVAAARDQAELRQEDLDAGSVGGFWPIERIAVPASGGAAAILVGTQHAPDRRDVVFIGDVLGDIAATKRASLGDRVDRARAVLTSPPATIAAALAYVLRNDADNFAVREMPSLRKGGWWTGFRQHVIEGWLRPHLCIPAQPHSASCPLSRHAPGLPCPGQTSLDRLFVAPLRDVKSDRTPWRLSHLYLRITHHLIDCASQIAPHNPTAAAALVSELLTEVPQNPQLCDALRTWLLEIIQAPKFMEICRIEYGLRWDVWFETKAPPEQASRGKRATAAAGGHAGEATIEDRVIDRLEGRAIDLPDGGQFIKRQLRAMLDMCLATEPSAERRARTADRLRGADPAVEELVEGIVDEIAAACHLGWTPQRRQTLQKKILRQVESIALEPG